jgi:signal transduction histidine kinase
LTVFARLTHRKLRVVLSLLLVLTFTLPAVLAGVGFYYYTERMVTEEVSLDLTAVARSKAEMIHDWLQERRADAEAVAGLTAMQSWIDSALENDRRAADSLRLLLEQYARIIGPDSQSYVVYSADGAAMLSTASTQLAPPILEAVQTEGAAYVTHWSGHKDERPRILLYVPLANSSDSLAGVLAAALSPEPLFSLVTRVHSGTNEHVHLADSAGRLLTDAGADDYTLPDATSASASAAHGAMRESVRFLQYHDKRGTAIVASFATIPDLGWTLFIERDYADAFQRLVQLHTALWSLLVIIVILGGGLSVVIANLTVTRLERRERELRTTHQQLITADRLASVGMMAASVAHEINNPLTTIKVLIHSLQEHLAEDDVRRDDLGIVLAEIDKMKALVLRFLQFARPREPEFSTVDLGVTLSRIVSLIRPQVQGKGITLVERYDEQAGPVWADGAQIGQVFLNILLNAVDATPSGGEIHVTMEPGAEGGVAATIWNSGPGLPDELRERIFEPFFSTKPTGTGLGLSIARTIVGKHQGTIQATGHGEKGTSFVISLPARSQEREHAPRSDR